MVIRSLVLLSFAAAAFSFTSSAGATGSGGSSTGTAGATSTDNPNCSVALDQVGGTTCKECDPTTSACSSLGTDYSFVCQSSTKTAVYCNGPNRASYADQNVACSVSVPGDGGAWSSAAAGCALAASLALMMRRRRRS